jgi:hypothetical protein
MTVRDYLSSPLHRKCLPFKRYAAVLGDWEAHSAGCLRYMRTFFEPEYYYCVDVACMAVLRGVYVDDKSKADKATKEMLKRMRALKGKWKTFADTKLRMTEETVRVINGTDAVIEDLAKQLVPLPETLIYLSDVDLPPGTLYVGWWSNEKVLVFSRWKNPHARCDDKWPPFGTSASAWRTEMSSQQEPMYLYRYNSVRAMSNLCYECGKTLDSVALRLLDGFRPMEMRFNLGGDTRLSYNRGLHNALTEAEQEKVDQVVADHLVEFPEHNLEQLHTDLVRDGTPRKSGRKLQMPREVVQALQSLAMKHHIALHGMKSAENTVAKPYDPEDPVYEWHRLVHLDKKQWHPGVPGVKPQRKNVLQARSVQQSKLFITLVMHRRATFNDKHNEDVLIQMARSVEGFSKTPGTWARSSSLASSGSKTIGRPGRPTRAARRPRVSATTWSRRNGSRNRRTQTRSTPGPLRARRPRSRSCSSSSGTIRRISPSRCPKTTPTRARCAARFCLPTSTSRMSSTPAERELERLLRVGTRAARDGDLVVGLRSRASERSLHAALHHVDTQRAREHGERARHAGSDLLLFKLGRRRGVAVLRGVHRADKGRGVRGDEGVQHGMSIVALVVWLERIGESVERADDEVDRALDAHSREVVEVRRRDARHEEQRCGHEVVASRLAAELARLAQPRQRVDEAGLRRGERSRQVGELDHRRRAVRGERGGADHVDLGRLALLALRILGRRRRHAVRHEDEAHADEKESLGTPHEDARDRRRLRLRMVRPGELRHLVEPHAQIHADDAPAVELCDCAALEPALRQRQKARDAAIDASGQPEQRYKQ